MAQSIIRNLVNEWWGNLEIGNVLPWKGKYEFQNIHTLIGVAVNGEIENGIMTLQLIARKDCNFLIHGAEIEMKKGEIKKLKINSNNEVTFL
ncbi:MAG: hypothetical protein PVH88_23525 [Ignavibacteria bacterium]